MRLTIIPLHFMMAGDSSRCVIINEVVIMFAWGEEDDWIPIERGRQLNAAIPGSKLVPIPAAGHLVQEDQPQVLLEVIRKFLL